MRKEITTYDPGREILYRWLRLKRETNILGLGWWYWKKIELTSDYGLWE